MQNNLYRRRHPTDELAPFLDGWAEMALSFKRGDVSRADARLSISFPLREPTP